MSVASYYRLLFALWTTGADSRDNHDSVEANFRQTYCSVILDARYGFIEYLVYDLKMPPSRFNSLNLSTDADTT
jgi:hypothetical protein